jgi:hypothetical protein
MDGGLNSALMRLFFQIILPILSGQFLVFTLNCCTLKAIIEIGFLMRMFFSFPKKHHFVLLGKSLIP